jgi:hypothetical protein
MLRQFHRRLDFDLDRPPHSGALDGETVDRGGQLQAGPRNSSFRETCRNHFRDAPHTPWESHEKAESKAERRVDEGLAECFRNFLDVCSKEKNCWKNFKTENFLG